MTTRIAFADDHPTLLRGMTALFEEDEQFEIVGVGRSADEAVDIVARYNPTVLVTDLSMPGDIYSAIARIREGYARTSVIVFTAYANTDLAHRAIDAGARGFVLKGRPTDDLYSAIAAVMAGELYISPGFAEKLERHDGGPGRPRGPGGAKLSRRERQIVELLLEGRTNREIGEALELREKTIKHYMSNLMGKLNARNRLEVVSAVKPYLRSLDHSDFGD